MVLVCLLLQSKILFYYHNRACHLLLNKNFRCPVNYPKASAPSQTPQSPLSSSPRNLVPICGSIESPSTLASEKHDAHRAMTGAQVHNLPGFTVNVLLFCPISFGRTPRIRAKLRKIATNRGKIN